MENDQYNDELLPLVDIPKPKTYPLYSWRKGFLNYRVERNYKNGLREVVCRISRFNFGAEEMAIAITKLLEEKKDIIPCEKICDKHSWIRLESGLYCPDCNAFLPHHHHLT